MLIFKKWLFKRKLKKCKKLGIKIIWDNQVPLGHYIFRVKLKTLLSITYNIYVLTKSIDAYYKHIKNIKMEKDALLFYAGIKL